jgi:Tol biopolymer transport system component
MALDIGTRLGPYEIQAAIGAGGMGEVYRARDTRLHRDVAIKVLPELFASDPDRLARFEREAQVLASLNHPNIAAIHGIEDGGGTRALVLEFVDGPTLADRIAKGPIPLDEALPIARQIAEALEAAHEHGIIHRDLKPANVKVRPDGVVKVLDFGLAKLVGPAEAGHYVPGGDRSGRLQRDLTAAPTVTSPAIMTGAGVILGTAAHMAPEQAKGRVADKRCDVWAFGCVLYEMLTGKRAFKGDDVTDVLVAVLSKEPDWSALSAGTPAAIRRLLRRCLEKDRRERLPDIGSARLEIKDTTTPPVAEVMASPAGASRGRERLAWVMMVVLLTAASGMYLWQAQRADQIEVPPAQVQVVLPPGVHIAVDTEHPALALSPDGSQLVFVGDDGGRRQLYVRDLADRDARVIPRTEGASSPFYSPDGAWIGFFDGGLLKKVPSRGGVPVAAHASTGTSVNGGATWTLNDTVIIAASPNSGLSRGSIADDRLHRIDEWTWITDNTRPYAWPHALPNGQHVIFTDNTGGRLDDAHVAVLSLQSGQIQMLVNGGTNPRYSPTGHVLFARGGALYAVPFDAERAEATGPERLLLNGVMTGPRGAAQFTVTANGTLAYIAGDATPTQHELVWADRSGRTQPVLDDGRTYEDPRLSPDGTRLAFTTPDGANFDIWVRDLVRGSNTRVTTHPGEDFEPVWSPDGTRLVFASEIDEDPQNPGPGLAWIAGFGQRPEQLLRSPGFGNWEFPLSWSPDGRWLAFAGTKGGTSRDIFLLPTAGTRQPTTFLGTAADEAGATFSPDGRWIAYVSDETGREEVYVRPFPGPGAPSTISTEGGVEPRWARSGRELFYRSGNKMMAVNIGDGSGFVASAPTTLFEGRFEMKGYGGSSANYDVSPDGRFVMIRRKNPVIPTVVHVVFNWPRAFANQ